MTIDQVTERVRSSAGTDHSMTNHHGISLEQALVPPREISIIDREVRDGKVVDQVIRVWLVGNERPADGYKIIMRGDGLQFGLASSGFAHDPYPILVGWYGSLIAAFMGM
jgi:hypothetical protein